MIDERVTARNIEVQVAVTGCAKHDAFVVSVEGVSGNCGVQRRAADSHALEALSLVSVEVSGTYVDCCVGRNLGLDIEAVGTKGEAVVFDGAVVNV